MQKINHTFIQADLKVIINYSVVTFKKKKTFLRNGLFWQLLQFFLPSTLHAVISLNSTETNPFTVVLLYCSAKFNGVLKTGEESIFFIPLL